MHACMCIYICIHCPLFSMTTLNFVYDVLNFRIVVSPVHCIDASWAVSALRNYNIYKKSL